MLIAVTSTGDSADSQIDQRFGRARYFMVHDTEAGTWNAIDNKQDFLAAHGAGIQSAQNLVDQNVSAIITGNCGPKAYAVLNAAHIAVYHGFTGSVSEGVQALQNGSLSKSTESSVDSGFGSV